jgi:aminopeptidase YwaD
VDGKQGTPGALDNAAGVVTLLLLAELLREYRRARRLGVEITAINGDHYSAAGEIQYLRDQQDTLKISP